MSTGRQNGWQGAEDERWGVFAEEGIRTRWLKPLVRALDEDFEEQSFGYRQLLSIADDYERAVVSELISRSAMGLADNLLEARLAQRAFEELMPPDGLRMPVRETLRQHIRDGAWADMHLAAFVWALESGFDCLAAVAMGVLRVPKPLSRAQLSQFNDLPNLTPSTHDLVRAWRDWSKLLSFHEAAPPAGWREWLNSMRNLHAHRAHQSRVLIQRTIEPGDPQVLFVSKTPDADMMAAARFNQHLRRRPRLADMEDYVLSPTVDDLWIDEPAQVTLAGVFDAANEFVEDAAHFLLAWWRYAEKWSSTSFPPPRQAWKPTQALGRSFGGAAPSGRRFQAARGEAHPNLNRRLAVAHKLRVRATA